MQMTPLNIELKLFCSMEHYQIIINGRD